MQAAAPELDERRCSWSCSHANGKTGAGSLRSLKGRNAANDEFKHDGTE